EARPSRHMRVPTHHPPRVPRGSGRGLPWRQRYRPRCDAAVTSCVETVTIRPMFTGIVRERGRVAAVDGGEAGIRLVVEAPATAARTVLGDSVAVSGVCLTVVDADNGTLAFDAVPETLRRSSLADLTPGDSVNLEPALRAGEPLGG